MFLFLHDRFDPPYQNCVSDIGFVIETKNNEINFTLIGLLFDIWSVFESWPQCDEDGTKNGQN